MQQYGKSYKQANKCQRKTKTTQHNSSSAETSYPNSSHKAVAPTLKGQLKDHKDTKPLREVSDASKSPGHELAKVLNKLFEPYTSQTKTAITGGKQLINSSEKADSMAIFYLAVIL